MKRAQPGSSTVPPDYRGPVRSCLACRTRRPQTELLRLARTPAGIVIDPRRLAPGRGAYVCPDREPCRSERQLRRFARQTSPALAERLQEYLTGGSAFAGRGALPPEVVEGAQQED